MKRKGLLFIFLGILLIGLVSAWSVNIDSPINNGGYSNEITKLDWYYSGLNKSDINNVWYDINGDVSNFPSYTDPDTIMTINMNSQENNNTCIIYVNTTFGEVKNDTIIFWVDSIDPIITFVNPLSSISYTNTNTLTLIVNLFEINPGYYSGTREIRRIFNYPESIGGSHDANYDLDSSNDSDASHTLWNPADRAEGNYTYTVYAKDIFPNGSIIRESSLTGVIIRDLTPPEITLIGNNNITIQYGDEYNEPGATAWDDLEGDLTDRIVIDNSSLNVSKIGTYVIYYNVDDSAGNSAETVNRTVNVIDTTPPEINLTGSNPQEIEVGNNYTEYGANATDNYDGNLTDNITIDSSSVNTDVVGNYEVLYSVNDSFGNSVNMIRIVKVVDNTAPVITLIGNSTIILERGVENYTEYGANATDNYDGNLTNNITINSSSVNTDVVGIYNVIYYVEDSSGNNDSRIRTVNVTDTIAPIIEIFSPIDTTYDTSSINLNVGTNELNCNWKYSFDDGLNNETFTPNATLSLSDGSYNLTVYVSDESGNENSSIISFDVDVPSKTSSGSKGNCKTVWNCTSWSEWEGCINSTQHRTCLEKERVKCGEGIRLSELEEGETRSFCVTEDNGQDLIEEPEIIKEPEETPEETKSSGITGSVIGFAKSGTGILTFTVIGILLISWTILHFRRKGF